MTLFTTDDKSVVQKPITETKVDEAANYLEQYVGEGKKYSDIEAAMKALHHSQTHIPTLEEELANAREEIARRATMEDFLDKIESRARTTNTHSQNGEGDGSQVSEGTKTVETLTPEKIKALVKEATLEEQTNRTQEQNWNTTASELQKAWGPAWQRTLISKQQELGLSQEFMNSIAAKSPKALLNLVGVATATKSTPNLETPPRTQMAQSASETRGSVKNQAYWDAMQKKDPRLYNSAAMTAERHRIAQQMGRSFFE